MMQQFFWKSEIGNQKRETRQKIQFCSAAKKIDFKCEKGEFETKFENVFKKEVEKERVCRLQEPFINRQSGEAAPSGVARSEFERNFDLIFCYFLRF